MNHQNPFLKLGISSNPIMLAPLAGVSDHPFRRICSSLGADLTYVEMISATALNCGSKKTLDMLYRHPEEKVLGVQITSKTSDEMGKAVETLNELNFDTIDINMGCPVRKVVNSGCGSAILKDPKRVYDTTLKACQNSDKPVSVKIRLGWDHSTINFLEVADAAQSAGAKWLTMHGRTRSDTYAQPVDIDKIRLLKKHLSIPVIGNGNIFSKSDADFMMNSSKIDGVMVSRGALGNPWVFRHIKTANPETSLKEWYEIVLKHLKEQELAYGDRNIGSVCMRKHILWYLSGWPSSKKMREKVGRIDTFDQYKSLLHEYYESLLANSETLRFKDQIELGQNNRFLWNPVFDMDRSLDRGVGDDGMNSH